MNEILEKDSSHLINFINDDFNRLKGFVNHSIIRNSDIYDVGKIIQYLKQSEEIVIDDTFKDKSSEKKLSTILDIFDRCISSYLFSPNVEKVIPYLSGVVEEMRHQDKSLYDAKPSDIYLSMEKLTEANLKNLFIKLGKIIGKQYNCYALIYFFNRCIFYNILLPCF